MTINVVQLIEANTYNVSNPKKALNIFYTRAGPHGVPSKLTVEWQNCKRSFEGNEITENKVQELVHRFLINSILDCDSTRHFIHFFHFISPRK